jgi:hypothetical protein
MPEPIRIPTPDTWRSLETAARSLAQIADVAQASVKADWNGDDLIVGPPDPFEPGLIQDRARRAIQDWSERREARQAAVRLAKDQELYAAWADRTFGAPFLQAQFIVEANGTRRYVFTMIPNENRTAPIWEVETSSQEKCTISTNTFDGVDALRKAIKHVAMHEFAEGLKQRR